MNRQIRTIGALPVSPWHSLLQFMLKVSYFLARMLGSWRINIPTSSLLQWRTALMYVLHHLLKGCNGICPLSVTLSIISNPTALISNLLIIIHYLGFLPSFSFLASTNASWNHLLNKVHPSPCPRVSFLGSSI